MGEVDTSEKLKAVIKAVGGSLPHKACSGAYTEEPDVPVFKTKKDHGRPAHRRTPTIQACYYSSPLRKVHTMNCKARPADRSKQRVCFCAALTTPQPARAPKISTEGDSSAQDGHPSSANTPTQPGELLIESHQDEFPAGGHLPDLILIRDVDEDIPILDSLHFLLYSWDKMLRGFGFTYWLHAGTLLGQWCNEGLLPGHGSAAVAMEANEFLHLALRIQGNHSLLPGNTQLIIRYGKHADILAAKWADLRTGRFVAVVLFYNMNQMDGNRGGLFHAWSNGKCNGCVQDKLGIRLEVNRSMLLPTAPAMLVAW
jgi:hypothetical protein